MSEDTPVKRRKHRPPEERIAELDAKLAKMRLQLSELEAKREDLMMGRSPRARTLKYKLAQVGLTEEEMAQLLGFESIDHMIEKVAAIKQAETAPAEEDQDE